MRLATKIKIVFGVAIASVVTLFLLINRKEVEVNLIFASITMSRAIFVLTLFGLGFVMGWLAHSVNRARHSTKSRD